MNSVYDIPAMVLPAGGMILQPRSVRDNDYKAASRTRIENAWESTYFHNR